VFRRRSSVLVLILLLALALTSSAEAQTGGGEPAGNKYQLEARVMFWAASAESGSLPDQDDRVNDFLVRRLRILLQGQPTKSISFSFQFGQDNIGARLLGEDGSIRIKDAYLNYRAAGALQLVIGQFKIPFLRANLESGFNQLLVDRGTLPSLRPAREGSRDLGAMAWGNVRGFQYRLAVFDGSDQEARNSTSSFRITSRVARNWFTRETGLGYTGSYLGTRRVLQVAGQADVQQSRLDPRDDSTFSTKPRDYRSYAIEGYFEQPFAREGALTADGAWFDRKDDYIEPGLPSRHQEGYYLEGGLLLPGHVGPGRVQFAVRREDWDTGRGALDLATTRTTGGLTYYLKGHDRKVQADYTGKHESNEVKNNEVKNNEFRLSIVLVF
jgi:hypothetical protein